MSRVQCCVKNLHVKLESTYTFQRKYFLVVLWYLLSYSMNQISRTGISEITHCFSIFFIFISLCSFWREAQGRPRRLLQRIASTLKLSYWRIIFYLLYICYFQSSCGSHKSLCVATPRSSSVSFWTLSHQRVLGRPLILFSLTCSFSTVSLYSFQIQPFHVFCPSQSLKSLKVANAYVFM